ncbi:MAG TPA: FAD binding domain-containing protein [Thermoflexales bacterium]|nr:FAD binding domain-containing protein [Thermoflexales bacterium]HQY23542.1 FAD binding domain-containing protein [Thermoflexales bacterium]HQZ54056.1 FAD binding domain-containing protein [Thermoflexales bacterium]
MSLSNLQEYLRPTHLEEALRLIGRASPRSRIVAGGTWVSAETPRDLEAVVDIGGLALNAITLEGAFWRLGATASLQALIESPAGTTFCNGVLGEAAMAMAGRSLRNRATLGGAIATADSVSPLVTALLACDAELSVATLKNDALVMKRVGLRAFLGYRANLLEEGALITDIRLGVPSADTRAAYERVARTPRDYPIVCAVARCATRDGIAGNVRLALGGVAAAPIRIELAEFGLEKKRIADHIEHALGHGLEGLAPAGDWLGSADYRRAMARELSLRALMRCAT